MADPNELEEHSRVLHAVVARYVGRGADADDLVQETLLRALTHPPDPSAPLTPWLVRVARNLAIDQLRRSGRTEAGEVDEQPAPPSEPRSGGLRELLTSLGALSQGELRVVLLREVLELSVTEVAAVLETTPSTVSVLAHRARTKTASAPASATLEAGLDAVEGFLVWLLAREVAGLPVRASAGAASGPDPGLTSGVLAAHSALLDGMVDVAQGSGRAHLIARARLARGTARSALGRLDGARDDLQAALVQASSAKLRDEEALAASRLGWVLSRLGRPEEALAVAERGLRRVRRPSTRVALHALTARLHRDRGDSEAAARHFDALRAADLPDLRSRLLAASAAGEAAIQVDRFDEAVEQLTEALALASATGDLRNEAAISVNLGVAHLGAGRYPEAAGWLDRAASRARRCGDERRSAAVLNNLALLAQLEGRLDDAAVGWERALAAWRRLGLSPGEALARVNSAVLDHLRGDPELASRRLRDGRERLHEAGLAAALPFVAVHLAAAEARCGRGRREAFHQARAEAEAGGQASLAAAADLLMVLLEVGGPDGRRIATEGLAAADERSPEVRTAAQIVRSALGR